MDNYVFNAVDYSNMFSDQVLGECSNSMIGKEYNNFDDNISVSKSTLSKKGGRWTEEEVKI